MICVWTPLQDHNCVRELRAVVSQQQSKMAEMQTQLTENKLQLAEHKREIQVLKVGRLHFTYLFTYAILHLKNLYSEVMYPAPGWLSA